MATIKISIIEARHLPIMDRATSLADAYVLVKVGEMQEQTGICPKTRNPVWRRDFRFDVADLEALQEDPIEVRLYDHDRFSRDDMIGSIFVDVNCLLSQDHPRPSMRQWFPIFDTLSGLRGELLMSVKLRFSTRNPFAPSLPMRTPDGLERPALPTGQSLTTEVEGVFIFSMSRLDPSVYRIESMFAMVEELLVIADPEQSTLTSLRSSRTTYEARMLQLFKLSGRVRRQLSRKVLGLGCNCVLGYSESFDLERVNGMIVRACGTPCVISRVHVSMLTPDYRPRRYGSHDADEPGGPEEAAPGGARLHSRALRDITKLTRTQVALITVRHLPPCVLLSIGGTVAARSVKLVVRHRDRQAMLQERDVWWNELRDEVKANASALRCNAVIAYTEEAEYFEDCALMSVMGTAVVLDSRWRAMHLGPAATLSLLRKRVASRRLCSLVHARAATAATAKCGLCGRRPVPDVIIASCEIPNEVFTVGSPRLIEVRAVRATTDARGVDLALGVSQVLPHLEYRLHQQLLFKLKYWGMNAAFQLRVSISLTNGLIVATATATAVRIAGLPLQATPSVHVLDQDVARAPIVQRLNSALGHLDRFASAAASAGLSIDALRPQPQPLTVPAAQSAAAAAAAAALAAAAPLRLPAGVVATPSLVAAAHVGSFDLKLGDGASSDQTPASSPCEPSAEHSLRMASFDCGPYPGATPGASGVAAAAASVATGPGGTPLSGMMGVDLSCGVAQGGGGGGGVEGGVATGSSALTLTPHISAVPGHQSSLDREIGSDGDRSSERASIIRTNSRGDGNGAGGVGNAAAAPGTERATFQVEIDDVEDAEGMLGLFDGVPHADLCCFSVPYIPGEPNMFEASQGVVLQRRYVMAPTGLKLSSTEYVSRCVGDARKALLYKLHRFAHTVGTDAVVLCYRNETAFTGVTGDLHVRLTGVFASLAGTSNSRVTLLEEAARAATERLALACESSSSSSSSSSSDDSSRSSRSSSSSSSSTSDDSSDEWSQSPNRQHSRPLYMAATAPFTLPFVMQRPALMAAQLLALQQAAVMASLAASCTHDPTLGSAGGSALHSRLMSSTHLLSGLVATGSVGLGDASGADAATAAGMGMGMASWSGMIPLPSPPGVGSPFPSGASAAVGAGAGGAIASGGTLTRGSSRVALGAAAGIAAAVPGPSGGAMPAAAAAAANPAASFLSSVAAVAAAAAAAVGVSTAAAAGGGMAATMWNATAAGSATVAGEGGPAPHASVGAFPPTRPVVFTPLCHVPGRIICEYLGRVSQHFIREAHVSETDDSESLGSFLSATLFEVHTAVTALVAALGGDALIDHATTFHEMWDSDGSSTGYLFLTVTGHAVVTSADPLPEFAGAGSQGWTMPTTGSGGLSPTVGASQAVSPRGMASAKAAAATAAAAVSSEG